MVIKTERQLNNSLGHKMNYLLLRSTEERNPNSNAVLRQKKNLQRLTSRVSRTDSNSTGREEGSVRTSQGRTTRAATNPHRGSVSPRVLQALESLRCGDRTHPLTPFHFGAISSHNPHLGPQEWNKNRADPKEFRGGGELCVHWMIPCKAPGQTGMLALDS